jgi:tetratricopeptide (TPR) repeat protein
MSSPPASRPDAPVSPRLNSWKEIAAYLGRDARTVQRWEKNEGLPVHRYWHEAQASVYAIPAELDEWLSRRAQPAAGASSPAAPLWRRPPLRRIAGLAGILAIALVLVSQPWRVRPVTVFDPGSWVLVEGFENHTGEPLFDNTLETALKLDLRSSEFIRVAGRERVEDVLRLMRKPSNTRVDAAVAREIALRDSNIRLLVTGRIEKSGAGYLLTADLVDPSSARVLASSVEAAEGADQVIPAVQRLSGWLRVSLGEARSSIHSAGPRAARVTTSSLRALQLFSQAEMAVLRSQGNLALPLYREALAEDPNFAMAHVGLARALRGGGDQTQIAYELQRARDLAATVAEPERDLILGAIYLLSQEPERALPLLEKADKLHRDDYFSHLDLATAYARVGRQAEAAMTLARLADLRPNDFRTQARVATSMWMQNLPRASQYARRALLLMLPEDLSIDSAPDANYVVTLPFFDEWSKGAPAALAELEKLSQRFSKPPPNLAWRIGECYLGLGRIRAAREWYARSLPPERLEEVSAYVSFAAGDERDARARLLRLQAEPRLGNGDLLMLAARLLDDPSRVIPQSLRAPVFKIKGGPRQMQGELALAQGRLSGALEALQYTLDNFPTHRGQQEVAESLVRALELSGNRAKALEVLEQAHLRTRVMQPIFWVRNAARLATYYRQLGRAVEARGIEDELHNLLAAADPDFYILGQLSR